MRLMGEFPRLQLVSV